MKAAVHRTSEIHDERSMNSAQRRGTWLINAFTLAAALDECRPAFA
jgi:hypothetical protein